MNRTPPVKKIGIVSGTGPLAGADVLTKVFKIAASKYAAKDDADFPGVILISKGVDGIDSTANLNGAFKKELLSMVQQLESQGANIIGIACNTAHIFFNEIKTNDETTLVNLPEQVVKASKPGKKHLLLTSRTTWRTKLYHKQLKKYRRYFRRSEFTRSEDARSNYRTSYSLQDRTGKYLAKQVASKNNWLIRG